MNDSVWTDAPWRETFVIFPRKTISGKWVWMEKCGVRRLWEYDGFAPEPVYQYATLFDILSM